MQLICWLGVLVVSLGTVLVCLCFYLSRTRFSDEVLKTIGELVARTNRLRARTELIDDEIDKLKSSFVDPKVLLINGRLQKSTEDAACWDVYSDEEVIIQAYGQKTIKTGIVTEMFDCDAFLYDRSGLAHNNRVSRRAGVIDEKYPKEWGVILVNEGPEPFIIRKGDRIAQAYFQPKDTTPVKIAQSGSDPKLPKPEAVILTQKRDDGFGSTGK
jgi:dUTP pyrophosphatase